MEASEIPLWYVHAMCIVILNWNSGAYYLLYVCLWLITWKKDCFVHCPCSMVSNLLNSFVVHAYIHLMKQKSLSKFSLSRPVRWTKLLEDKQYLSLGISYVSNLSTFPNTFAIILASFLHDLDETNPDWRCFQQSYQCRFLLCKFLDI